MELQTPSEILLPDAMRAPDVSPSSAKSELERREPDRERPILDPRDGDAEDDVSSPKQKSLLAIAGSLLAEISLTKLLLAWIVVDRAAGGDPRASAAHRDGVGRRRLFQSPGIVRIRRRASASRDRRRRLVRLASACFASPRRISGRSTRLAFSRDTPCAARRSGIWRSEPSSPRSGAELARMRAMSCAGAGVLLAAVAALVASRCLAVRRGGSDRPRILRSPIS